MYKTIIIKNAISNVLLLMSKYKDSLDQSGSLFCIVKNEYQSNQVKKDFMDVINYGISINFNYINTIIIPDDSSGIDNISYCVWLCKNKNDMYFNKDLIREKPIWKDVEWGKRSKNYNPKGKDPGNVWIPTEDDGKANITKHILLKNKEIYNRLLISTLVDKDKFLIISDNEYDINYSFEKFKGRIEYLKCDYETLLEENNQIELQVNNKMIEGKVFFTTSENMDNLKNKSVDLIVTSPPYWDLKDYYKENQIGQESYQEYSNRIKSVWSQCYKKLSDKGSLWININIRVRKGIPVLLPKLFIEQCKDIGFKYKGILIWHKSSGIPTNNKNLVDHHEYVLIFTKESKSKIKFDNFNFYEDYKNSKINKKFLWNINRKAGSVGKNTIHPAIFPTELINRIIKLSTDPGDIVLDPFLGSGTSLIAALNNKRNFVGYEFNEGFKELMISRFKNEIDDYDKKKITFK